MLLPHVRLPHWYLLLSVAYGNARSTLAGVDPNRIWKDPNLIIHPVVFSLKEYLRGLELDLFLDLHGHSQKCAAFFYGCGREV